MKITHHLNRFTTFFKESSIAIQLVIVASGIGIIAGTATVAAMVATPSNKEVSTDYTTNESSDVASDSDNQPTVSEEKEETTDTDTTTTTPQTNQATAQNNTQTTPQEDSTSNNNQQETQPQTPVQPTYTDTYPFKSNCSSNSQQTSTQMDSWGYNKCYSSSYTAYKVAQTFGTAPQNWGNPKAWLTKADNENIPRGTTPKLHSVGIQTTGGAGWSVWVEAVHSNGTIDFSYYNFNNNLNHGTQYNVNPSAFSSYIYFGE